MKGVHFRLLKEGEGEEEARQKVELVWMALRVMLRQGWAATEAVVGLQHWDGRAGAGEEVQTGRCWSVCPAEAEAGVVLLHLGGQEEAVVEQARCSRVDQEGEAVAEEELHSAPLLLVKAGSAAVGHLSMAKREQQL